MEDKEMSVYEHIDELRRRLIIISVFFVIALVVGLFIAPYIITYLQAAPTAQNVPMNAFKLTDPFRIYMTFAFVSAVVLTFPIVLYHIWAFVSPGLEEKERRVTLSYIPIAFLLFIAGICFAYFILFPFIIQFMGDLAEKLNINEMYGINEYFSFLFQITLPFGILFQLPVVVMFLTRLGIITPQFLSKIRKYAYFVLLIIAGLITPPELMSHLMVSVPLFALYEISIWISKLTYRKVQAAELARIRQEQVEAMEEYVTNHDKNHA